MDIANRRLQLKAARASKGMTHRELAERMRQRGHGFDSYDVARIIAGRWSPPEAIRCEIADILGRPTFEIF